MIFSIFDAGMASTGPRTYPERCGSKFCVGWRSGYLYSSHMEPIGEKPVARMASGSMDHVPWTRTMDQGPRTRTRDQGPWDQDQGPRTRDHGPSRARDQARTRHQGPGIKPDRGPSRPKTKPGPGTKDQGPSRAQDQAGPGPSWAQDELLSFGSSGWDSDWLEWVVVYLRFDETFKI